MAKGITGIFSYPNPQAFTSPNVSDGTLIFSLSAVGDNTGLGVGVVPVQISYRLDENGFLDGTKNFIIANDEMIPAGTTYTMWLKDSGGGQIMGPLVFSITGTSPINLNNLVPVG